MRWSYLLRFTVYASLVLILLLAIIFFSVAYLRYRYGASFWDTWSVDPSVYAQMVEVLRAEHAALFPPQMHRYQVIVHQKQPARPYAVYAKVFRYKTQAIVVLLTDGESDESSVVELLIASPERPVDLPSWDIRTVRVSHLWEHPNMEFAFQGRIYRGDALMTQNRWVVGGYFHDRSKWLYVSNTKLFDRHSSVRLLISADAKDQVLSRVIVVKD